VTPERWQQVTAVFHAARARTVDEQRAFLDDACGPDLALRAEVEALLGAQAAAGPFGDGPVSLEALPEISAGMLFGPYRVEGLVGVGGMGEVYRATDTRLRRTVALKLLRPDRSLDPEFGARFEREGRLLASLNHPNIAAIHGLEQADGVLALVLEFVEGPTLADRLARGALPIPEALALGRQITLALEAAHERSIVHRDLKPANIKITPTGVVKVLDFGIARVNPDMTAAAATTRQTRPGSIVGTPAYMSPEQARGLAVDKRTDVWAFGCVLFEMLSGRGAFTAGTASDSLARVLEREPDWQALPARVPELIRWLVRRCLQKDPADRLHDIADARIEIGEALKAPVPDGQAPAPPRARRRLIDATWAFGLLAGLAAATWWWLAPHRPLVPASRAVEFGVTFPNNFIPADGIAVSPDGRQIAAGVFGNSPQIWVHSLESSETRLLPGTEGGGSPFWSPDSSRIGFFIGAQAANQIVTMSPAGGALTRVAQIGPGGGGASWSRDGVILFADQEKLFRVPASGGTPMEVPVAGIVGTPKGPTFLPDGRHFIFCADRRGGGSMELGSLDSDRATVLGESECPGGFAPPDRVLFVRHTDLVAQKLDLHGFTLEGEAELVASNVTRGAIGDLVQLTPSASDNDILAIPASRGGSVGQLTWFNRDGKVIGAIDSPSREVEYLNPAISPDGTLVAANRMDQQTGIWHVWVIDPARGNAASRLTTDPSSDFDPVWSPNGREIAFASERGGRLALYRQSLGGGQAELLVDATQARFAVPSDWSPDGRYILYHQLIGVPPWSIWALPVFGERVPVQAVDRQFAPYAGRLSPDGRWLAYASAQTGQFEVFVQAFPSGSPRKKVSNGGGLHPRWVREGKELAYWANPNGILSNELSMTGQEIRVGPPKTLVDHPVLSLIDTRTHYDITRDGQRILVRQPAGPPSPGIRVIVNWMAKLK
jgi:Tol biopolymer transport system component